MPALAAPATVAPIVHATGWTAVLVNAERRDVASGATLPLCQAIPPTVLNLRLRYRRARPATVLRMRVRAPGHRPRLRTLRLDRTSGRAVASFTPQGLWLLNAAFPEGRYVVRLALGSRPLARATLRLAGGGTC